MTRRIALALLQMLLLIACLLPQTACATLTLTRVSSTVFYTDFKKQLTSMYVAYQVSSSTALADAWAGIGSFTGGSVALAQNEDGVVHLGPFSAGQTKTAFFYLTASTLSSTAQGHVVTVYGSRPPSATALATQAFSLIKVDDTIAAAANKVTSVVSGPNPPGLGGLVTVTVTGHTGTLGNDAVLGDGLVFTPASYGDWPANKLELVATRIDLSGANSGSYSDLLLIDQTSITGGGDTDYTAVYTFRATGTTSAPTAVSPTGYIPSGIQIKHTDDSDFAVLAPIQSIGNYVLLSLLATPATLPAAGGVTSYTVRITNSGSNAANLDSIIDLLPANPAQAVYLPGSAKFNGVALLDPVISGSTLTWNGTFAIPAGASRDLTFQATLPATTGTYTNSVSALAGDAVIDATLGAGDSAPATASTRVLQAPIISTAFAPDAIASGATGSISFAIKNPNLLDALAGVGFSDALPAGSAGGQISIAATPGAAIGNCGAPTFAPLAGASNLNFSNATIAAGATCTVTVEITAGTPGTYANSTSSVSSTNGGVGNSAAALLTVGAKPTISKSFAPASIAAGASSTLTVAVSNNSAAPISSVAFNDPFPSGMVVAAIPAATSSNCGAPAFAPAAGASSIGFSGGAIAAGATCTITVAVTAASAGSYDNVTSGVSSSAGSPGAVSNTATLTVTAPDLRIAKTHAGSFTVATPGVYTLSASNAGNAVTSGTITVVDTLPSGLAFISASGAGWNCGAAGQIVSCSTSAAIAPATTLAGVITLTVAVNAAAVPGVTNVATISGGGEPADHAGDNSAWDATVVAAAAVEKNSFAPDGMQTTMPGSTVFYLHQFSAGQAGTVAFGASSAPDPAIAGWNFVLYRDADCSGNLSAAEVTAPLSGAIAVAPGALICIIVKEFAPASAPDHARDVITVSATLTPASGPASTQTRLDTTLIGNAGGAGLVLQKSVQNVTTGGAAGIANVARSGDTLEYTISYANYSSTALATIAINDATPAYTRFTSAACKLPLPAGISACTASTQPGVNGSGPLEWRLSGALSAAAGGSVTFRVTVD